MALDELEKQIERERKEIEEAPKVVLGPALQRCHFCGRLAREVVFVESVNGQDRYKGVECCGQRHAH